MEFVPDYPMDVSATVEQAMAQTLWFDPITGRGWLPQGNTAHDSREIPSFVAALAAKRMTDVGLLSGTIRIYT